jgi:hypothetical protein
VSNDKGIQQLQQVTIKADDQIEAVNKLLADGWRLLSIGYQSNATVYVLGQAKEKSRHRPGFLGGD